MTLPFDEFTADVLRFLNLAPTQLHPNSWACLQAFRMVCQLFDLTPRVEVFLFYYNTYPSNPVSWVSLVSRPRSVRFAAFTTSYKNFKERYFKVLWSRTAENIFTWPRVVPSFPFIGRRIQPLLLLIPERPCRCWARLKWRYSTSSLTSCPRGR